MRYAALIEYNGTHFKGWQSQREQRTVQGTVEQALSHVADETIQVVTAGRTDTAVHATAQVIHFDSNSQRNERAWVMGANTRLPHDVRIHAAQQVSDEFHARFAALRRSYRYIIYNQRIASALYRNLATHEYRKIELKAMQEAAQALVGEHDFSSFRAAGCQAKSPLRTISRIDLHGQGKWIWFDVHANAFLQHMVRNIAGVLLKIGAGERPVDWVQDLLQVCDRTKGGVTAPPEGLYLTGVGYPEQYGITLDKPSLPTYWN